MKKFYDTADKRTVVRLFLWFIWVTTIVHSYYIESVSWAIEKGARDETLFFAGFLAAGFMIGLYFWQRWDGFTRNILLRYGFSCGIAVLSYVVFYPAYFNAFHAPEPMPEIYTLSGHPVVLSGYAVLALIATFWSFAGMFPTEAWDVLRGRERKSRLVRATLRLSESLKRWAEDKLTRKKHQFPMEKPKPVTSQPIRVDTGKLQEISKELDRVGA